MSSMWFVVARKRLPTPFALRTTKLVSTGLEQQRDNAQILPLERLLQIGQLAPEFRLSHTTKAPKSRRRWPWPRQPAGSGEGAYAKVIPDMEVQAAFVAPKLNPPPPSVRSTDWVWTCRPVYQPYSAIRDRAQPGDVYSRNDGILAKTDRSLELIRRGYEGGETGVQDLLFVQRTYFETNLAYPDSLREFRGSVMEIRGSLLPGSPAGRRRIRALTA